MCIDQIDCACSNDCAENVLGNAPDVRAGGRVCHCAANRGVGVLLKVQKPRSPTALAEG